MELYLDSANLKEIEEGFKLGFLDGLTTTPSFMQREGITDIDGMILKLSKIVPVLQIEALGDTAEARLAAALNYRATGACAAGTSADSLLKSPINEPTLFRTPMRGNRLLAPWIRPSSRTITFLTTGGAYGVRVAR